MDRQQIETWTIPVISFSVATLVAIAARQVILRALYRRVTDRTGAAQAALDAIRTPSILWSVAAGLAVAIHNAGTSPAFDHWANKAIGGFAIISIGLVAASIGARTISVYGGRNRMPFAVAGLSRTLTYVFVFSIVGLMLLRLFDVTITPLLTALGVGGLAVALALQDTLANFFAGVHILIEEPIAVGDFIRLSSGEEGIVRDIGWRTTRIHTFGNNMVVIPNTKITSGILTNYNLPEKRVSAEVVIVAGHEAEPDRIAAIAMDAASETEGVLEEPSPTVIFDPGITPTHMQMKLIVHVAGILDRGRVQSEIRARIFDSFRREGVPFPVVRP